MNSRVFVPLVIAAIAIAAIAILFSDESASQVTIIPSNDTSVIPNPNVELTIMETDGVKHIIPLDKIKGGGPPKDGIPSIDDPVFATSENAHFMSNSDTVIGLEIDGEARAYPLFILVWHEIVNDVVGGVPVSGHILPFVLYKSSL